MIAQTIAIEHPTRVLSLTSIMSTTGSRRVGQPTLKLILTTGRRPVPARGDAIEMGIEMYRKVSGPTFDANEFRELAKVSIARSYRPAGTGRQAAAIIASGDRTAALRRLRVPTLVIHGMLDPLVKPSGGVATAAAIAGSRLVMFNDMAHDLPKSRHREIAEEIAAVAGLATRQPIGI
jgi:pimeloyl-ACP methyl ester carboxylesterase